MEFANGNRHAQPCPDCERSLIQQIHQNAKRQHHLYCRQWHQSLINHRSWHPQSLLRCRSSQHEMNTTFLNQRTTTGFHCSRCQPSLNATICCPSIDLHCLTAREATSSQPDEHVELCRTVSTGTFATTAAEHQELDSSDRTQVRKLKQFLPQWPRALRSWYPDRSRLFTELIGQIRLNDMFGIVRTSIGKFCCCP